MSSNAPDRFLVAAFYAFTPLQDSTREQLLETLLEIAERGEVRGSVLVALEGVNGTVSGPPSGVESLLTFLRCLLYTSPSPRDVEESRMPSSA